MSAPRLKKHLGQHHLVDGKICRPLVEFLDPAGHRVLEIGPGGGVLTRELAQAQKQAPAALMAIELDPAWAFELRARLAADHLPSPHIVIADALAFPWNRLPAPTHVCGNLPYNVATPLIERIVRHHERIPKAAFLVQKEVAQRLAAKPGEKPYGLLSVLAQARSQVRLLGTVKPGSFRPPPKVDSAFVGLTLQAPPLPELEMPAFEHTARTAFAQRRKTLLNNFARDRSRDEAATALEQAGIEPSRRAETLSLEELLALHEALQ